MTVDVERRPRATRGRSGRGGVRVIAHRGASSIAPENTLAAIRLAIAGGLDLVEVDVQRSRDGELFLMHDTTLVRTTDVRQVFPDRRAPWLLSDFTSEEIRRLDAGSWLSPEYAGERVPTLAEALAVVRSSAAGLQLELKAPALYPGLATGVAEQVKTAPGWAGTPAATEQLLVQSFSREAVQEFSAAAPGTPVGLLGMPARTDLAGLSTWVDQVNPSHHLVSAGYVDAVHRAGMECVVWTVNREASMHRVARLGVDGIITDRPEMMQRVLRDREDDAA